ncbi:MAG: tetratricopeptide repeat protein, partial [Candidatus Nitrosopolaris sp.]
ACYDKALELNSDDAVAWNAKAWLFVNLGKGEIASSLIDRSLQLDPTNRNAMDTKGFILYNLGKYESPSMVRKSSRTQFERC